MWWGHEWQSWRKLCERTIIWPVQGGRGPGTFWFIFQHLTEGFHIFQKEKQKMGDMRTWWTARGAHPVPNNPSWQRARTCRGRWKLIWRVRPWWANSGQSVRIGHNMRLCGRVWVWLFLDRCSSQPSGRSSSRVKTSSDSLLENPRYLNLWD